MSNSGVFVVRIKPLTPIWTGDENGRCTELRETGIIGSLRWWYEALIRGLGGTACDPTSDENRCPDKKGKHCDACELFGCTGWARKFRLEVEFNTTIPKIWVGTRKKRGNKYLKRNVGGFMSDGAIVLKFIPIREIYSNEWSILNKTLEIIANYGALGARISQGNGVIKIIENNLPYKDEKPDKEKLERKGNNATSTSLNLKYFFFYKFHIKFKKNISNLIDGKVFWTHQPDHNGFKDNWEDWKKLWNNYHFLPIAFHIRDAIRRLENDENKRHEIFGELGKGSKVFVSHGYKIDERTVEVRIWGYVDNRRDDDVKEIGSKIRKGDNVEEIKNKIKEIMVNEDILKKKLLASEEYKEPLKKKLLASEEYKEPLESCKLVEETTGEEILEELK